MTIFNRGFAGTVAGAAMMLATPAFADAWYGDGGAKEMAVAPAASDWTFSANVALATEYVFRGISQTAEDPAIQGGFDVTYKKFYAGVWASNLDFGSRPGGGDVANIEIDYYGGWKPSYGKLNFDLGVIYYQYPGAFDFPGAELDYVEFKAGVSTTVMEKIALGATTFFSPDNTGEIGDNFVFEGTAGYSFNKLWFFTPTLSGLIGFQEGEESEGGFDYTYWNVGMTFAFWEKPTLSLDVRYWDTDLSDTSTCSGPIFQCDERVVGTFKATF